MHHLKDTPVKNGGTIFLFVLLFYGSFALLMTQANSFSPRVVVQNNKIYISKGHSRTIPFSQIDRISLYPYLPTYFTSKHSGSKKWRKGYFKAPNDQMIHVHLGKADPPIIKIKVRNDDPSYISLNSQQKTNELYEKLIQELEIYKGGHSPK